MLENQPFVILPKVSIRPDKIVFYNQVVKPARSSNATTSACDLETKTFLARAGFLASRTPASNKHNFELSEKAGKRIREKVSWLYSLARNKTVTTSSGKVLTSFKMNFITLTLPAMQEHSTPEIIKTCLNQFFIECKTRYNLEHYVWRLEYQKNGNAHFHIATDTYMDFYALRTIWNRCLNKLGYVDRYSGKYSGMTFNEYLRLNPVSEKQTFGKLKERFTFGVASRWTVPNTVDVKAVSNAKNISFYISKYITKKSEHTLNPLVSEREETSTNMRLWFCSRSLSKVVAISEYLECISDDIHKCLEELQNVKRCLFDYCEVFYFSIANQTNEFKGLFYKVLRDYAHSRGYFGKLTT